MAVSRLSLEAPTILNTCVLRLVDTSTYNADIVPVCPQLQISIPGFPNSIFVNNVTTEFSLNLSACDLQIQTTSCGSQFNDLPDGIYVIRYSISPNDTVFVTYNHLRQSKALKKIQSIYCDLDLEDCVSNQQKKKQLEEVKLIETYLKASKANVEYCQQSRQGLEIFRKACQMLEKFNCRGCRT